jgi:hypothetical protein
MASEQNNITLELTGKRTRTRMARADYMIVRDFILKTVSEKKEVLLADLIDKGLQELADKIKGDIGWYLLQVKEDLICRKILITIRGSRQQRLPALKLKKKLSLTDKELQTQYS